LGRRKDRHNRRSRVGEERTGIMKKSVGEERKRRQDRHNRLIEERKKKKKKKKGQA
jgi:hypothetical protein